MLYTVPSRSMALVPSGLCVLRNRFHFRSPAKAKHDMMRRQLAPTSACDQALSSADMILALTQSTETLEIENFVHGCPGVCKAIAGYANPDLVGIGVSDCFPSVVCARF